MAEDTAGAAEQPALASSLSVSVTDAMVRFRLDITNPSSAPVVLEFPTSQRTDFAVLDGTGTEVWRSSAQEMYAQVLGADTVAVGETRSYETTWSPGEQSGNFVATVQLTSTSHPIDLRTDFELTQE